MPLEMTDAILMVETGLSLEQLDNYPENLLTNILLYKGIKNVMQYGGELKV